VTLGAGLSVVNRAQTFYNVVTLLECTSIAVVHGLSDQSISQSIEAGWGFRSSLSFGWPRHCDWQCDCHGKEN